MPTAPPACSTCRYYHAGLGECRRYPPVLRSIHASPEPDSHPVEVSRYPEVEPDGWCGEHRP